MIRLIPGYGHICKCDKCGHRWIPRLSVVYSYRDDGEIISTVTPPKRCAQHSCRSPQWNSYEGLGWTYNGEPVSTLEAMQLSRAEINAGGKRKGIKEYMAQCSTNSASST